ncbi:MAG: DNA replication/repair protein RecF [Actinomycetota bacterium]|nr:DNA replication/repair protein RecF [Actinomycetota bacterium]
MSSYVRAVRLVNFRNYADATALFSPGLNIVVGDNAQGKTNLLEAISFATMGSSPRTPNDSEVVRWGADFARTEMRVSLDQDPTDDPSEERKVAVGYAPGQKKRLTVDGAPASSLATYAAGGTGVRAVTFFPDDIGIVKGAPADRREFLDGLLSSLRPSYARAVAEYAKAVQQRNQLLRRIRDGFSSERTLSTWDRKVMDLGTEVLKGREAAAEPLTTLFGSAVRALYGPEKAALKYSYSAPLDGYAEALSEARGADIERGTTSVGPHRDDFAVLFGEVSMTTYGSQGQQRLSTLALKFAAREYLRRETGQDPVLLFDDVMSELDEERRGYLSGYFLGSTQAIITTTNLEYFDEEVLERARVIRISGGTLSRPTRDGAKG